MCNMKTRFFMEKEYYLKEIDGEVVKVDFSSTNVIEKLLLQPEHRLFLFKENKQTKEITQEPDFCGESSLPNIKDVIISKGYNIHTFNDCLELYQSMFENDENYLPFDDDEIYITLNDVYQGCCTRNGFEFTTKDYHYFFGIKSINV